MGDFAQRRVTKGAWTAHPSRFFDLDHGLTLVRAAVQAGVMRQLQLVTLGTDRHPGRRHAKFLRAALVASRP